jgi:hypothetical protein
MRLDEILSKNQRREEKTVKENKIDLRVYKLCELTYDEVLVVDG